MAGQFVSKIENNIKKGDGVPKGRALDTQHLSVKEDLP